jgi:hypothetical protein
MQFSTELLLFKAIESPNDRGDGRINTLRFRERDGELTLVPPWASSASSRRYSCMIQSVFWPCGARPR